MIAGLGVTKLLHSVSALCYSSKMLVLTWNIVPYELELECQSSAVSLGVVAVLFPQVDKIALVLLRSIVLVRSVRKLAPSVCKIALVSVLLREIALVVVSL